MPDPPEPDPGPEAVEPGPEPAPDQALEPFSDVGFSADVGFQADK